MENKYIILYDGECSFCSYWVSFVLKHDKNDVFRFASLQSEKGRALIKQFGVSSKIDSVVLIGNKKTFIKSNAVFSILNILKGWRRILIIFKLFPRFIRDFFYDIIARYRYRFSTQKACELPLNNDYKTKFL